MKGINWVVSPLTSCSFKNITFLDVKLNALTTSTCKTTQSNPLGWKLGGTFNAMNHLFNLYPPLMTIPKTWNGKCVEKKSKLYKHKIWLVRKYNAPLSTKGYILLEGLTIVKKHNAPKTSPIQWWI